MFPRVTEFFAVVILAVLSVGCASAPRAESPSASAKSHKLQQGLIDVRLPGSRVRFKVPPGYVRPSRMTLLVREDDAVRIVIQDTSFFESNDAAMRGVKRSLLERSRGTAKFEAVERSGAKGLLVRGRVNDQDLRGIALSAPEAFVLVVVLSKSDTAEAERIVDSVEIDRSARFDPLEMVGVDLELRGRYEAISGSPLTFILPKGVRPPLPPGTPHLALAAFPHPGGVPPDDAQEGELVGATIGNYAPDMSKAVAEAVVVDGMQAIEVVVPGTNEGAPILVYALVMPDESDTLILFGTLAAGADADLGELRRLARSLRRKAGRVGRIE
jgi:hypothetical protein